MRKVLFSLVLVLVKFISIGQASLPFGPFGGTYPSSLPPGLTTNTTGSYQSGAEGQLSSTADFYQLQYNAAGGTFTAKIIAKVVGTWSGTVDIQHSIDGITWTSGQTITSIGANNSFVTASINPPSTARYIRIFFTSKVSGSNVGIDDIALTAAPLPITLISFKASLNSSNQTVLKWATASEKDNYYFEIERSKNAIDFESLGKMNGKGTSDLRNDYAFTDETPLKGINYYRLKQVDFDGTFSYTRPESVITEGDGSISLYPNPTVNVLKINFEDLDQIETATIYNQSGVMMKNLQGSKSSIDIQELPQGKYILQIRLADQRIITNSFVKF
jgi:Secretion system C-terminal sorting domain